MGQILGLKFKDQGSVYLFKASPFVVNIGDKVLVKTEEGLGLGKVVSMRSAPPADMNPDDIKPIYRLATVEDLKTDEENRDLAKAAYTLCRDCIRQRELEMKLVDVEVYFDRSKIIFYFTAPGRIDFRDLVKDLVRQYRTRIELRQIGVRHETQMIGGLGNCGQVCCCRRYLRRFEPVTIKMAKEQNLFLNPAKISGACGRLLCCLSYEQGHYIDFRKQCPKIGKSFSTGQGKAKILRTNLFRNTVGIQFESGEEKEMLLEEWEAIRRMEVEESEIVKIEEEVVDAPLLAIQDVEPVAEQRIFLPAPRMTTTALVKPAPPEKKAAEPEPPQGRRGPKGRSRGRRRGKSKPKASGS